VWLLLMFTSVGALWCGIVIGYVAGSEGCLVAHRKQLRTANEELEKISLSLRQSTARKVQSFMVIMTNRSLG